MSSHLHRAVVLLILAASAAGCRTARAAGEDISAAVAAINPTEQGAEAVLQGSIADLDLRTRAVLMRMGIQITETETENNAMEREYVARRGDRVVHVKLEARGTTSTQVNVSSREGTLEYDKSHARTVLEQIQRQR